MPQSSIDAARLGREVVADGRLKGLRVRLGLTRNAMAELLHTSALTYTSWETREVTLWPTTAIRVGRFFQNAEDELEVLREHEMSIEHLVPFHIVSTLLGVPQEQLLRRYREGEFSAVDIGILGLWVPRAELQKLRHH